MTNNSKLFYSVFLFLCFASSSSLNTNHKCSEKQSDALLLFKQSLSSINFSIDDPIDDFTPCKYYLGSGYYPIMMNWSINTDCCNWDGITCDHFTGDVIGIDLSCGMLQGTIHPNSTLFRLPRLQRLNLALNYLGGSQIPREIHRFSNSLTHLNISQCFFEGQIPAEILFLPRLISLDLSFNGLGLNNETSVFKSLLQNFTHLKELSFAYVNASSALPTNISSSLKTLDLTYTRLQGKLPDDIFNLPYLEKLVLSKNHLLTGPLPKVNHNTSSRLKWLDLSGLSLSGKIPDSIGNMTSLNYLYLYGCNLMGPLPKSLLNLKDLTTLRLSGNKLNGTLPSWLFTLPSLENILLDHNMFSGGLPSELFNHSSLKILILRENQFDGEINQALVQLMNLTNLDLSYNNFTGEWDLDTLLSSLPSIVELHLSYSGISIVTNKATSYVNPDFSRLELASCKLTMFPQSLQAMKNLENLDLSGNYIQGRIPDWAGEIGGNKLSSLDLSNNSITVLPQFQWHGLVYLHLQSNHIEGPFPPSICNNRHLELLDISNNRFGGRIPQCFSKILSSLSVVNIGNNNFHGTIPNMNVDCESLQGFILNGNQLEGDVPSFLSKCQSLQVLDIGNNYLNGTFPSWFGDLSNLQILVLKSNSLHGSIEISSKVEHPFPSLRVLDLSHNGLVGHLPQKYFQNFIAMKDVVTLGTTPQYFSLRGQSYSLIINVKGHTQFFSKVNIHYTIVDLSDNNFEGEIPIVIGSLNSLVALNLSYNYLNGSIPYALGNLLAIESLDLSRNRLVGEIPQSLVEIKYLEVLDLSQNRLVRRIPTGKQFDTFEETSFGGNLELCGHPLPQLCEPTSSPQLEDDGDEERSEFTWKEVMLGYGCGTVIGMVMGYLMLSTGKPKWFNAMADAVERTILKWQSWRRYIYIGK